MEIDQNGIDFIIANEGIRYTAYLDTVGVWTIGVGHTKGVYQGMTITHQQAIDFLYEDIKTHQRFITFFKRSFNQNQFNALSSFEFNVGGGVWYNDGWNPYASDTEIVSMLSKYKRPPEITARRNREIALYQTPSSGNPTPITPNTIEELKNMEFIYSYPTSGTFYFDGTSIFSLQHPSQLDHITGTYEKVNKKKITSLSWTKEQHEIWNKMYPVRVVKV